MSGRERALVTQCLGDLPVWIVAENGYRSRSPSPSPGPGPGPGPSPSPSPSPSPNLNPNPNPNPNRNQACTTGWAGAPPSGDACSRTSMTRGSARSRPSNPNPDPNPNP